MSSEPFSFYRLVKRGGPGLACDFDGLAIGPIALSELTVGERKFPSHRIFSFDIVEKALILAYGAVPKSDIERVYGELSRIAQILSAGEDARARIQAVLMGFPEIDRLRLAKMAAVNALQKYNPNWADELRISAGYRNGGEWADGGEGGAVPPVNANGSAIEVAYQGNYHDEVVAGIVSELRGLGMVVATNVPITAIKSGVTANADIVARAPDGEIVVIEVKTGNRPDYTPPQKYIYPLIPLGGHVYSDSPKMYQFGLLPGEPWAASDFDEYYKRDEYSPHQIYRHKAGTY